MSDKEAIQDMTPPVVDPADYKPAMEKPRVKKDIEKDVRKKKEVCVDIRTYLSEAQDELKLVPLQVAAFTQQYRGRILPRSQWKDLLHGDVTRRVR